MCTWWSWDVHLVLRPFECGSACFQLSYAVVCQCMQTGLKGMHNQPVTWQVQCRHDCLSALLAQWASKLKQ